MQVCGCPYVAAWLQALGEDGTGRVLVVDGGASMRCALLGDVIAGAAVGWMNRLMDGADAINEVQHFDKHFGQSCREGASPCPQTRRCFLGGHGAPCAASRARALRHVQAARSHGVGCQPDCEADWFLRSAFQAGHTRGK